MTGTEAAMENPGEGSTNNEVVVEVMAEAAEGMIIAVAAVAVTRRKDIKPQSAGGGAFIFAIYNTVTTIPPFREARRFHEFL